MRANPTSRCVQMANRATCIKAIAIKRSNPKQSWPTEMAQAARNMRLQLPRPSYAKIALILRSRFNRPDLSKWTVRDWADGRTKGVS